MVPANAFLVLRGILWICAAGGSKKIMVRHTDACPVFLCAVGTTVPSEAVRGARTSDVVLLVLYGRGGISI